MLPDYLFYCVMACIDTNHTVIASGWSLVYSLALWPVRTIVLQNVELQNVELQNVELQNAEFQNIELQNAKLQNVKSYKR